jgi:hypothetical protein
VRLRYLVLGHFRSSSLLRGAHVKPNPCLGPLETPPFYGLDVYPGDIGVRLGVEQCIDVSAQESQLTLDRTRLSRYQNDGLVLRRERNRYGIIGMLRCRDRYIHVPIIWEEQWDAI